MACCGGNGNKDGVNGSGCGCGSSVDASVASATAFEAQFGEGMSSGSGDLVQISSKFGSDSAKASGGTSRRGFLKILGSSAALGAAGCADSVKQNIFPNVRGEYDQVPGVAVWYKSTCTECSAGCGIMVRTREGRAVKVEGNPDSAISKGGLCALGQSSLQSLYDPDRIRQPLKRKRGSDASSRTVYSYEPITWDEAYQTVAAALKDAKTEKAFITGEITGSIAALVGSIAKGVGADHVMYDATQPVAVARASELVYGVYGIPQYRFEKSDIVLNFGADFLETFVSPVEFARGWAETRKSKKPTRVVQVEPRLSLTGSNADLWLRANPGSEQMIAALMVKLTLESGRLKLSGALAQTAKEIANSVDFSTVVRETGISKKQLLLVASYLENGKAPLILAGGASSASADPLPIQVTAAILNAGLGAIGKTVNLAAMRKPRSSTPKLAALIERMRKGEIGALFVHGANPAFTLPSSFGYSTARNFVPLVVSFSTHLDETTQLADLILPSHHSLESWGDVEAVSGIYGLVQPSMLPVFDTRDFGDQLLTLALQAGVSAGSDKKTFQDYIKERWESLHRSSGSIKSFNQFWVEAVEAGGIVVAGGAASLGAADGAELNKIDFSSKSVLAVAGSHHNDHHAEGQHPGNSHASDAHHSADHHSDEHGGLEGYGAPHLTDSLHHGDSLELRVLPYLSVKSFDGRAANRPWLQELPDPITTACWDSWAEIHPETASKLGISRDDIVQVRTEFGEVNVAVYLSQYVHKDVVAMPIGQGHTAYGRYARELSRGGNVLNLLPSGTAKGAESLVLVGTTAKVSKGIGKAKMTIVSGSDSQLGRPIGKTEWKQISADGEAVDSDRHEEHEHGFDEKKQMYDQRQHPLYQWGMAIDLSACTGCSACVVACYAENNIPVVGRDQVWKGREMSWIQIQRYFDGSTEDLHVSFVPMMCQQCQNAPCEPVCPVYATYHNEEGLNTMVYNRCVGTRYCSNNCAYKVRRFNWFEYNMPEPLNWQVNPDVTKRGLGVMEKCTFCVQRIAEAKDRAKDIGRLVEDGEVKPACVQSCPTQALTFGNLKDPNSRVSKLAKSDRAYKIMDKMINTQPSVTYLSRVRLEA